MKAAEGVSFPGVLSVLFQPERMDQDEDSGKKTWISACL